MKLLIKNATLINHDATVKADILIQNAKITQVAKTIKEKADREIDAQGKYVLPGFVDMHVHLRTPGRESEEDLASGSKAAAKGGFTTIFCMPNTTPPIDNEGLAQWIREESQKGGCVDIYPVGAITKERAGKELTEFEALQRAGCRSLSDDGVSVNEASLLRRALEYARMNDLLLISHCEDEALSNEGVLRESFISSKYGMKGIPDIAESTIVFRDTEIVRYLNAKIHIAHVSCAKSIEIIERAKKQGARVTCETAPHYFILGVDDIEKNAFSSQFKVNPPLGTKEDIEKIKQALKKGTIDCIVTDHAPHSHDKKELPFSEAPFGFIGLEWAFALSYTYLVKSGILDMQALVEKLSYNPARLMGFSDRGVIAEGMLADIVIIDPEKRWKIEETDIVSKSTNTPFIGYEVHGVVDKTIFRGKVIYEENERRR